MERFENVTASICCTKIVYPNPRSAVTILVALAGKFGSIERLVRVLRKRNYYVHYSIAWSFPVLASLFAALGNRPTIATSWSATGVGGI